MLGKRLVSIFALLFCLANSFGQTYATIVYFFPGTGSDERLFSKIILPEGHVAKFVKYHVPQRRTVMGDYAAELAKQIDTTQGFILVGVSVGGMFCTELADVLKPQKIIIISSSKCRKELPRHYRLQRYIPFNKLFGARFIKFFSPAAQAIVEPDRKKYKTIFNAMLRAKNPKYLKRTINMIINWNRTIYSPEIIHIHGTKDHTLPLKNISPSVIIHDGSHMMTLTRGEEISEVINGILKKE